jgi:peroxiredoxin family protein
MQQEKQDIKGAVSQAKGQYGTMQSTLSQMKDDEGKVSDQATKDYMQKNDQMWQEALQQEKEVGRAARQAHQHHQQKEQQSSSSNPQ